VQFISYPEVICKEPKKLRQAHMYGTVCNHTCDRISTMNSLSDFWKHFHMGISRSRQSWLFVCCIQVLWSWLTKRKFQFWVMITMKN